MRKSTIIFIVVIYIASIAAISLFGMKMSVYNEFIPVTSILCLNETENGVEVINGEDNNTILKTKFTEPYDKNTQTGTMIQLYWRVEPDNASVKNVKFVYDENNSRVEFYKTEDGEYTGLVLFYKKSMIDVTIMSTDGRRIYKEVSLWAY